LFCFGDAHDHIDQYTTLFGSKLGDFPIWHFSVPIYFMKPINSDWKKVEQRFEKGLSTGKHLPLVDV
jgi:hypothetical protein